MGSPPANKEHRVKNRLLFKVHKQLRVTRLQKPLPQGGKTACNCPVMIPGNFPETPYPGYCQY